MIIPYYCEDYPEHSPEYDEDKISDKQNWLGEKTNKCSPAASRNNKESKSEAPLRKDRPLSQTSKTSDRPDAI